MAESTGIKVTPHRKRGTERLEKMKKAMNNQIAIPVFSDKLANVRTKKEFLA